MACFGFAILALASLLAPGSGSWAHGLGMALRGAFGWASVLVSLAVATVGLLLLMPRLASRRGVDWLLVGVALMAALGLSDFAVGRPGSGLLGQVVFGILAAAIGGIGAAAILAFAVLACVMLVARPLSWPWARAAIAEVEARYRERQRLGAIAAKAAKSAPSGAVGGVSQQGSAAAHMPSETHGELDAPTSLNISQAPAEVALDAAQVTAKPIMRVIADPADDVEPIEWQLPPLALLDTVEARRVRAEDEIKRNALVIEKTLQSFGVEAKVIGVNTGPAVTQYEVQPGSGVSVRRIAALNNDLSLALAAAPLRIETPIPGKSAVGIEVPNKSTGLVSIKEVLRSTAFQGTKSPLAIALGHDVAGQTVVGDLATMPHLLIAGSTGSGKSVCVNSIIVSLLMQCTPEQLRLIMIDPKRVELTNFNDIPHLLLPVLVEPDQAVAALRWAVAEMDRRYKLFAEQSVRNIKGYNEKASMAKARPIPYMVVVIDELADLMMVAAGEIEELVCRLAQMARAVGIHLVVATQRPSADIITGLIKANIPSRIAFAVSSQIDSRVILDSGGAEKLLGRGDMLFLPVDAGKPTRLQGTYVSDREVEAITGCWSGQGQAQYQQEILETASFVDGGGELSRKLDPLFARAARTVSVEGTASVSLIQRKFNVGYSRAGRVVDQLADHRVVGSYQGSKSRDVLMSLPDVDELLERLGIEP